MSYNNLVNINDCITDLQTISDFNDEIDVLENILRTATLPPEDKERLQKLLTRMLIKNTKQADRINKVANRLNKLGLY